MSLTTSEMTPADIAAVTGGGNYGGNNGFGNDGWWVILFLILAMGGNWGNGFGGNGGGNIPWIMNTDNDVERGFNQQATMGAISALQSAVNNGFSNTATQLCNGFAGVNATVSNGFAQAEIADNARAMANMQQINGLQSQLAGCCCENRLASADLKYTIATENCADRYEAAQNTRDIIENANRNNQAIIDKLCQLELDAKNDKIGDLERQLTMANLAASQTAQTSRILADNAAQTVALEQYLNPVPVPAYVVQNPNCCTNTCNCGCGV